MRVPSSVSNLPFGSGASALVHQRLTRSTSAPLRARHTPVSGRLSETAAKGVALVSRFPVAFRRTGIGFLDRPAPAGELGLPHGRLTGTGPGPRRGCHVPHGRDPAGVGAPCTPGRRCSHGWLLVTSRRLPFRNGQPCPQRFIPSPGGSMSRHHREFACTRPSGLPLACRPRMEREPLGVFPELRTLPLPATHVRAGTDP